MGILGLNEKINKKISKAYSVIREIGRDIIYIRKNYEITDPEKPWQPVLENTEYNIKAVFSPGKVSSSLEGPIKRVDEMATVNFEDLGFLPLKGDSIKFTLLGKEYIYSITNVVQIQPGNSPFLYNLELKK